MLPSKMFPLLKCRLSMLRRKMPEMKAGELTVSVLVPLADLSMMGMVNVINPETGEMVQMPGAELAAQLAGDDSVQVLMSTPQNGEPVFKIQPADTAQKHDDFAAC